MGLERGPSLRTVGSQLTDRLWGGLCHQLAGSGMPSDARRHAVPRRPPPRPGSTPLQRRGAGQRCSPSPHPRRLYNERRTAAKVGGKMKSLLNAFSKKEGKDTLRGAWCTGIRSFSRALRGRGGLRFLLKLLVMHSWHVSWSAILSHLKVPLYFVFVPESPAPCRMAFRSVHPW